LAARPGHPLSGSESARKRHYKMKIMTPRISWRNAIVALAVIAVLIYGVRRIWAPPPRLAFVTAPVTRADLEDAVLAAGTVEAYKQVNVGAQVSGQIRTLKVALGDVVKKGDLIAEIDSLTQQNALRTNEAALLNVQAQLQARQATLKQAELAFNRARLLLEQDAGSRGDYEAAEATLNSTRAEIEQLKAQIVQARITVDNARVNLGYTRIVAPMDGTVVAVVAKEGQTVNANQTTPSIITLARLDLVTIEAQVSEADITRVKPGQTVYFTTLGEPDKRYTTTLRALEPAPESITSGSTTSTTTTSTSTAVYYNALLDVPNPESKLRISMTTQVRIVLAEARHALSIPAVALGEKTPDGAYLVRVIDAKGQPVARKVRIGINNTVSAEVLGGLHEGEQVIVSEGGAGAAAGNQRMRPPMRM